MKPRLAQRIDNANKMQANQCKNIDAGKIMRNDLSEMPWLKLFALFQHAWIQRSKQIIDQYKKAQHSKI